MPVNQGLTIADMAAANVPFLKKGTLEYLAKKFALSDLMKFTNTKGALTVNVARVNPDMQPPALYRGINSEGKFVTGSLEGVTETLKLLHMPLKIDRAIIGDTTNLFRPEVQLEMIAESMQLEILNAFINGDGVTTFNVDGSNVNQQEPKGVRYRLQNAAVEGLDQDVYTLGITGSSINLSGTITQALAYNLTDSLYELQSRTNANTLFVNFRANTILRRALNLTGALSQYKDNLLREWDSLFGMRIIVTSIAKPVRRQRNTADSTNWIQPWETVAGVTSPTSGKYTTFFAANIGEGHVEGLTSMGMIQDGPQKGPIPAADLRYAFEFGYGFLVNSFADVGGLYGVQVLP